MDEGNVTISVNGEDLVIPTGSNAFEVVDGLGFDITRVAVEIDGDICPRSQLSMFKIKGGERMEIVSFVGGG